MTRRQSDKNHPSISYMRNEKKCVKAGKTYVQPQLLRAEFSVERKHYSLNNGAPYEHQRLWVNHVYFNQAGS